MSTEMSGPNMDTCKRSGVGWSKHQAQEPGDGGVPDIKRPPDQDAPGIDEEVPSGPDGAGAPPFTGEDVEDVGSNPPNLNRAIM
jgi:hypothetical protein